MKYNFKAETDTAKLPTRHTDVSAGVDFYSDTDTLIYPGKSETISTGISWNPLIKGTLRREYSLCLIIQSRSGLAFKNNIEASNAGVIDQDYVSTEENKAIIKVKLYNHGIKCFQVQKGDKICQGIPQLIPFFDDIETLDDNRNGLGFGSSDGKEKSKIISCTGCGNTIHACITCNDFDNYLG